jgi:hypothetical protein
LTSSHPSKKSKKKKKPEAPVHEKRTVREVFNTKFFCRSGLPREQFVPSYTPTSNTAETQSFTPVFLAHARLYVLAEKYLIEPLKELTLYKLHKTLLSFSLYLSRVNEILELARYVFCNEYTPDITGDGKGDELRRLVVEYIVCEIDTIGKTRAFFDLLEEGGSFVRMFWAVAFTFGISTK